MPKRENIGNAEKPVLQDELQKASQDGSSAEYSWVIDIYVTGSARS